MKPARKSAFLLLLLFALPALSQQSNQRLRTKTVNELLDCMKVNAACGVEWYEARDELARRKSVDVLIRAFRDSKDEIQQERIVETLIHSNDPKVTRFMREIATAGADEQDWFALQYLAERGDRKSLAILNENCGKYPIPSFAWADTLKQFGRFRYRPAIPCLVTWVRSASLNAADAAYKSLRILFPGSPAFRSPEEAQTYFEKRAKEEEALKKKSFRQ